jgi:hypothetical protein
MVAAAACLLLGCNGAPAVSSTTRATLTTTAAGDRADRDCQIILRNLGRPPGADGSWETNGRYWVWSGHVDVAVAFAPQATVAVHYRPSPAEPWYDSAGGQPADGAPDGWQRFVVRLIEHTAPEPDWPSSSIERAAMEVIPMALFSDGSRLFDHNRHAGDFENYVLDEAGGFAINDDGARCLSARWGSLREDDDAVGAELE